MTSPSSERITSPSSDPLGLTSRIGPLCFLVVIFFLNFTSRVVLAPLMPTVEKSLHLGHGEAGSLFFLISLGYCGMLLASGFISSRLNHHRTIILSALALGGSLLVVGLSPSLWGIRAGLVLTGMSAGLYLPSGVASITCLVSQRDWGKAIAIHELAPNLGFILAPFLAEGLMRTISWQGALLLFAVANLASGALFIRFGQGGPIRGEAPRLATLRTLAAEPSFWMMVALFSLGIGASMGVYTMLPLYLVAEKGMDRGWANTLVGLSRVLPMVTAVLSGWVTDWLGPKKTLSLIFCTTGIATGLIGLVRGSLLIPILFLQPLMATAFFAPGFAALARIGGARFRNIAVSMTVPIAFLLGGGAIPAGIGFVGEKGSFTTAFILMGGLTFAGTFLARSLRLSEKAE
jgi:MFS transporter, NNP family, nitrate/nitrite transporter